MYTLDRLQTIDPETKTKASQQAATRPYKEWTIPEPRPYVNIDIVILLFNVSRYFYITFYCITTEGKLKH